MTSEQHGRGRPVLVDTGFYEFGPILAEKSKGTFEKFGVSIVSTSVVQAMNSFHGVPAVPLLIITPISGVLDSTGANYVFSVQIFFPTTNNVIWKGNIDTRTWIGKDFITKNFEKTIFNEKYAEKFNDAIIFQLKKDGIIN